MRLLRLFPWAAMAAPLAFGGCAALLGPTLEVGQTEADAFRQLGQPTARYALGAGVTRLEFASGPFGRQTWMVDVDASGRITERAQVLQDYYLYRFQQRAPGMSRDELLRTLGTPGERRHGGWAGGEVWSWRYATNECLWFQVSLGDDQKVINGSYAIDPRCDSSSDRS